MSAILFSKTGLIGRTLFTATATPYLTVKGGQSAYQNGTEAYQAFRDGDIEKGIRKPRPAHEKQPRFLGNFRH